MNVTDAMYARKTIRNFLDTPISNDVIAELLTKAARAPSGGNVQPWRVYVINGDAMTRFRAHVESREAVRETPEYAVYPPSLKDPYRSSRFKVGEDMYALLGIPREDKPARFKHLARNYDFFGAPASIFCFVDRIMGPPQWSDLGMFLQSFMLLAQEAGLETPTSEELAADLLEAIEWQSNAWLRRSRPGGLDDSLRRLHGAVDRHRDVNAPQGILLPD